MNSELLMFSMWGLVGVALLLIFYWSMSRNNDFSVLDFICTNGRGDPQKAAYTGAFLISTWLMWQLAVANQITEGYLGIYIGAFVLGGAYTATRKPPTPPRRDNDQGEGEGR